MRLLGRDWERLHRLITPVLVLVGLHLFAVGPEEFDWVFLAGRTAALPGSPCSCWWSPVCSPGSSRPRSRWPSRGGRPGRTCGPSGTGPRTSTIEGWETAPVTRIVA